MFPYKKIIFLLFAAVIMLATIDIRLAHSHLIPKFILFRKHSQAYTVFTFGITFWGFVLALPASIMPFRTLTFRDRYFLWVPVLMIAMEMAYLLAFLSKLIFR